MMDISNTVINMLMDVIIRLGSFLSDLFSSSGVLSLYFSMLFIFFSVRYLLSPIVGSAGSDTVQRKNKEDL